MRKLEHFKKKRGYIRSHSHKLKVRELTPNFTAASCCLMPAKNRFFLRCWPKVVGSLAIGKLRVQTGATSLRATVTLRSQKGNIAHWLYWGQVYKLAITFCFQWTGYKSSQKGNIRKRNLSDWRVLLVTKSAVRHIVKPWLRSESKRMARVRP